VAVTPRQPWQKYCAFALVAVILALALVGTLTSMRWVGNTFPGFVIMANRVIASISLPPWSVAPHQDLYHHQVIAVNGQPVGTAEDVYAAVAKFPPGSEITYTLAKGGQRLHIFLASQEFTVRDYCLLFLAYLFTGLSISLTGITVWFLQPASAASRALCIAGFITGIWGITGMDLYGPHWFFRLHVIAEALFPAAYVHLALVFPSERLHRFRRIGIAIPYMIAALLAIAHELFLYHPTTYSLVNGLCMLHVGVAGAAMLSSVLWEYWTTTSYLNRQRIRIICLGFLSGYGLPVILLFSAGITGGAVSVNYMAFTGFLFPLSLGYAIVKHDLFDIDALVKRAAYYLALTTALTLSYVALLAVLNLLLHASDLIHSPLFPLAFTVAAVLLFNLFKEQLQTLLDRFFFRPRYNPQKVLEQTIGALASTLSLDEILPLLWNTIRDSLGTHHGGIFLLAPDRNQYLPVYPPGKEFQALSVSHPLIQAAWQRRGVLTVYDTGPGSLENGINSDNLILLNQLNLQLLILMSFKDEVIGVLALGRKESGEFFSAADRDFLIALANQGALSIANALSYQEIQILNASLEQKVADRTQELAHSNRELHNSLEQLEQTYQDLQRSQDNLLRAERMAALGRLTAGIAHEMNTPLGATLTTLKLMERLVTERRLMTTQPDKVRRSPQEIDDELEKLLRTTQQWLDKVTSYIRSLKIHTRDLRQDEKQYFSVLQTIEETRLLLAHRLRLGQCSVAVSSAVHNPFLYGSPGKLGQVLTNLINNAIDAYQASNTEHGEIRVELAEDDAVLEIRVSDHGCGIPPEMTQRIFDEFFSTKSFGEGTGLGLSIARDIVVNLFAGTISVDSTPGQGTTFIVRLPRQQKRYEVSPAPKTTVRATIGALL
jgi:signal transduction histidine kinase